MIGFMRILKRTALMLLLLVDRLVVQDGTPAEYETLPDGSLSISEDGSSALTENGGFVYFVWIIFLCWILLFSAGVESSFIYFQF